LRIFYTSVFFFLFVLLTDFGTASVSPPWDGGTLIFQHDISAQIFFFLFIENIFFLQATFGGSTRSGPTLSGCLQVKATARSLLLGSFSGPESNTNAEA
jgi:hypothetical protein